MIMALLLLVAVLWSLVYLITGPPLHPGGPPSAVGREKIVNHPPPVAAQRTLLGDAARRFARNRLALVGLAMVTILLTMAVGADQDCTLCLRRRRPSPGAAVPQTANIGWAPTR
jgi:hypothetical protein